MKNLTLGILAHVDAGKTTLSEGLLYTAGALRKLGRVDHGDSWLDTNENGMQDIGEPGIPGIRIQLYQGDELLAETETDLYGHYMFEGIYPGRYTLRVTPYPELKSTVHQTDFPLIGSVLPETEDTTINANEVIVPSGTRNLAVDVGFRPRQEGILPDVMNTIPTTDWSFGGKKR